jgi:hypothetical protein
VRDTPVASRFELSGFPLKNIDAFPRPDAAETLPRLRAHRRTRLEREGDSGGVGSTRRGLDPRPIAVRDFTKYTISTLPVKARDAVSAALAAEAVTLQMSVPGQTRHFDRAPITSGHPLPAQPVDATQALNLSAGVSNCKVSRGRSFS